MDEATELPIARILGQRGGGAEAWSSTGMAETVTRFQRLRGIEVLRSTFDYWPQETVPLLAFGVRLSAGAAGLSRLGDGCRHAAAT